MKALVLAFAVMLAAPSAHAVLPVFEAGFFYFSDTFNYSSEDAKSNRMFWDIMVGMPLTKKGRWILGWNYNSMSFSDQPAGEEATKLTVTDMGPKVVYYLDKERTWVVGVTYNLITKGKYTAAAASATELRGTSLKGEFGYVTPMSESLLMGAKLIYYKPSLAEEITNDTSIEKTSNSRTVIYPSFAITYRFD
ncbi:MAG: hypothetical protein KF799_15920 [Bdellovibrionales bacterium]|nr:hypothetical protein [Bdellovibrionales bacterium]